jgi:hypothetical protein
LETEPAKSQDANAPAASDEEPLTGVPAGNTTPSFAEASDAEEGSAEYEPVTPDESLDHGDPVWSEAESSSPSNGETRGKKTPEWAQTVQTDPGMRILEEEEAGSAEAQQAGGAEVEEPAANVDSENVAGEKAEPVTEAAPPAEVERDSEAAAATVLPAVEQSQPPPPLPVEADEFPPVAITTEPPRAVAADATKATWPPAAESPAAPPAETDIWPPEPPTEHAMPAWPPPSELEEPSTPAQAIPSWPDSFDAVPPAPTAAGPAGVPTVKTPAMKSNAPPAPAAPTAAPAAPRHETPAPPRPRPAAVAPVAPVAPQPPASAPAASAPPAMRQASPAPPTMPPAPPAPAHTEPPVQPSQPVPSRPAWAPHAPEEPGADAPPKTISPQGPINVPAWAPRVPLASEPGTPTWFSPKEQVRHTAAQPTAQPPLAPQPEPAPPVVGGQLPVAPVPPAPQPAPAQPAGAQSTAKPTWEVVNQPHVEKGSAGPTPEDRSYAEWFAWAKRGGAPASACHAAAQGAFKALAAGKDVQTAVQWATAAMSRPPENVSYTRQTYCAWFSLANIDLNLDQHRAHAFAMSAVHALDNGADASQAHAAGLAAAGIR